MTAAQSDVTRTITQPGTIQGIEEATLYARAAGYLKSIYVDKGDRVRAGQVLAVIESPELGQQEQEARSAFLQSQAAAQGVVASRGRALADVAGAVSGVEKARADAEQAAAGISRAQAEQARAEAQVPKLEALVQEADAGVQQAAEQQAQAQAEVARWQQQVKAARASVRTAESGLTKAQADARLQQVTYTRYKAIKDEDSGLIATQQVDEARARMEASQSEADAARSKVETAR
ncbi:MAG TPA: biotin/lipoyl-binding protein, partial [Armatimonadota bacterium]|nr:biotin/lipoyl-binding protein [Armatimonadota bacterium]